MDAAVLVVGAGPAGLATAACLQRRGIGALVVDRGAAVGDSWRSRYDRLHLHTPRIQSALPGRRIPRSYGRWVSRDDLVAIWPTTPRRTTSTPGSAPRCGGWRGRPAAGARRPTASRCGRPRVHGRRTSPDAPGLRFVGLGTPLKGLLFQIGLDARAAAAGVAKDLSVAA